jgi:hypothetical protein
MSEFWLKALEAAEAAEEEARRLRERYGRQAETMLDEALMKQASGDRRARPKEDLEDVRRALRWT